VKLAPCLWFASEAEEAARFYASLLPDSRIDHVRRPAAETPGRTPGDVLAVEFTLAGAPMIAINGGTPAEYTNALSLTAVCEDQAELDRVWDALADGGTPQRCGWLTDRYGVPWQVVPDGLNDMLAGANPAQTERVMAAMLDMAKLDIAALQRAFDG